MTRLKEKASSILSLHFSKDKHSSKEEPKPSSKWETLPHDVWLNFLRYLDIQQIKILRLTSKTLYKSLSSILFQASKLSNENTKGANARIIFLADRDPENIFKFLYNVSWPKLVSHNEEEVKQLATDRVKLIKKRIILPIKHLLSVEGMGEVPKFGRLQTVSICLEPPDYEPYDPQPGTSDPTHSLQIIRLEVVRKILCRISRNKNIKNLKLGPVEMSTFILPPKAKELWQTFPLVEWIVRLERLKIEFTTGTMGQRDGGEDTYKKAFEGFRIFLAHAKSLKSLTLKYPFESCPLKAYGDWYSINEVPSHFGRETVLNRLEHLELDQYWISWDFCLFIREYASSLQKLVLKDCFCFAQPGMRNTTWTDLFASIMEGVCCTTITSLRVITSPEYIKQGDHARIELWKWGQTKKSPSPDPQWERMALEEDRIKPLYLVLTGSHRLVPSVETRKRAISNDDQAPYDILQGQIEDNRKAKVLQNQRDFKAKILQNQRDFEAKRRHHQRSLRAKKSIVKFSRELKELQGKGHFISRRPW